MKNSAYAIGIISLAITVLSFSGAAVADGVTKVTLSSTPLYKVQKVKTCVKPNRVVSVTTKKVVRVKTKKVVRIAAKNTRGRVKRVTRAKRIVRVNKRIVRKNIRAPKYRYYYVKGGDNLYGIAKKYGVSVKHIIKVNNLKSTSIRKGITLKI